MRIIPVFLALLIIACNSQGKKKEDTRDTGKPVTAMPETLPTTDTIFTGFGTEPFWSVYVIHNNKIVFHPADGPDAELPYVAASAPDSVTTRYISKNDSTLLELTIIKKNCSDGMSEDIHPYSVDLSVNKNKYSGCGRKPK